ncbi:MAG: prepilin peptidase [Pseudomonadota bacterium]
MLYAFLYGIATGSFVTMASYRIPLGQDLIFKPSYCPKCHSKVGAIGLIPVFSWLIQRGKCRNCKSTISLRYPLIELSLGLTFCLIVYLYGLSLTTLFLLLLASELLILIVTDLEHYIIPDSIQIALLITGLSYRIHSGSELSDIFITSIFGLSIGLLLHYGYLYLRKKDALGLGDVKFLAVAGIWLSFTSFVPFLFIAGVIGTLTGLLWRVLKRGEAFPFAPALAISLLINVLFPYILG